MIKVPQLVYLLREFHGAFLVGSGAAELYKQGNCQPHDFDVIIPPNNWREASTLFVGKEVKLNTFGGLKLTTEHDDIIDLWPQELGDYFVSLPNGYEGIAWGKGNLFIKSERGVKNHSKILH